VNDKSEQINIVEEALMQSGTGLVLSLRSHFLFCIGAFCFLQINTLKASLEVLLSKQSNTQLVF
jgi:hypothetical protein